LIRASAGCDDRIMRSVIVAALVALTLAVASSAAHAQESTAPDWANKNGAVGIGATTTLNAGIFALAPIDPTLGSSGLHARYYVSETFGLHLTLGMGFDSDGGGNDDFIFLTGLYGSVKLAPFSEGHLSLIFGAEFGFTDTGAAEGFDVGGTGGLFFEFFPASQLSFFIAAGLRFTYYDRDAGGVGPGDGIVLTLGSSVWGSAGFTVWFK
jgi:hypothetical protein